MGIFSQERNAGMNIRDKEQPNATRSKVADVSNLSTSTTNVDDEKPRF
jgi:hypothetical protein